jgi:SET domain-containing protein
MGKKFEIKDSPIDAKGMFAARPIKKGETVCFMDGEKISLSEVKKRYEAGRLRLADPLQIGEEIYLDLYKPYVLVNHSCNPNAEIINKNKLVAIRDIERGREITFDYSLTEWSNDFWPGDDRWFECHCGSALCRGRIGELRYSPFEFQRKSIERGKVRDFITEKFKECYGG